MDSQMNPMLKEIICNGYHVNIPKEVFREYLIRYHQSSGKWDIIKAFDEWICTHKKK